MFFSAHAGSETLVVGGGSLEKRMSALLVDEIRSVPTISILVRTQVVGLEGDGFVLAVRPADRCGDRPTAGLGSPTVPPSCWRRAP